METYTFAGNDNDVACPHCRKTFTPLPLSGGRVRGFKCPHCRLFVPMQRRPA
jgi:hypothetical protein